MASKLRFAHANSRSITACDENCLNTFVSSVGDEWSQNQSANQKPDRRKHVLKNDLNRADAKPHRDNRTAIYKIRSLIKASVVSVRSRLWSTVLRTSPVISFVKMKYSDSLKSPDFSKPAEISKDRPMCSGTLGECLRKCLFSCSVPLINCRGGRIQRVLTFTLTRIFACHLPRPTLLVMSACDRNTYGEGTRDKAPGTPAWEASLRASYPIWASEASLARTRERAAKLRGAFPRLPRSCILARLTSLTQIG